MFFIRRSISRGRLNTCTNHIHHNFGVSHIDSYLNGVSKITPSCAHHKQDCVLSQARVWQCYTKQHLRLREDLRVETPILDNVRWCCSCCHCWLSRSEAPRARSLALSLLPCCRRRWRPRYGSHGARTVQGIMQKLGVLAPVLAKAHTSPPRASQAILLASTTSQIKGVLFVLPR